jgi:hypothetical protein
MLSDNIPAHPAATIKLTHNPGVDQLGQLEAHSLLHPAIGRGLFGALRSMGTRRNGPSGTGARQPGRQVFSRPELVSPQFSKTTECSIWNSPERLNGANPAHERDGCVRLMWFWLFYGREKTMDSAKRCREQSAQCLSLSREAQSETEGRSLRAMSDSWVRLANQIERYQQLANRTGLAQIKSIF